MPYYLSDRDLLAQCREDAARGGGPGGQHAQKSSTAVRLLHLPTGIIAHVGTHRERLRNHAEALRTLRLHLACTQRGLSQIAWLDPHRSGRGLRLGAQADDYPRVVGCLLDVLAKHAGSLAAAADEVLLSTSQLVRVLTADKHVHAAAQALRKEHGLPPMHAR